MIGGFALALLLASLLFFLWLNPAGAQTAKDQMTKAGDRDVISGEPTILDGDSLEVSGKRFQLYGIDAPEPGELCEKSNGRRLDCGNIARTALLDLTAGIEVVCEPLGPASATAISAHCTAGGFSLNRNMIHTGWALVDRSVTDDFIEVEAEAKQRRRGLWRYAIKPKPWPERE